MKLKSLLLATVFSFAFTSFAMAESAVDLFLQGVNAYNKGNYKQATKFYKQACDDGFAESCTNLGVLYDSGRGVKQNYTQAAKLYEQACDGDDAVGCFNLGVSYYNGQGKKQNFSTAKKYFGKACDLGEQQGCDDYRKLNMAGY